MSVNLKMVCCKNDFASAIIQSMVFFQLSLVVAISATELAAIATGANSRFMSGVVMSIFGSKYGSVECTTVWPGARVMQCFIALLIMSCTLLFLLMKALVVDLTVLSRKAITTFCPLIAAIKSMRLTNGPTFIEVGTSVSFTSFMNSETGL